jgi:transcriptional regulator with XRE-family HTH domain
MPRKPSPIDPSVSPWHLLGAELRHWRDDVCGLSQREAASRAFCDDADLSKWERGQARPQAGTVRHLDDLYGANGRLSALHAIVVEVDRLRTLADRNPLDEEDATERRSFLHVAAATLGSTTLDAMGEPVRQLLDSAHDDDRALEEWDLTCADHLHALRTRSPEQVAADLLIELEVARRQLRRCPPAQVADMQRVTAALATLNANVLTRLGHHGAAIRWWRTARTAAHAAGDLELELGIRATEAGHGLYGQRDPEVVLRLTEHAQRLAGPNPSLGLALVVCSQAKAFTLLGRHKEAVSTLDRFRDLLERDPPGTDVIPGYWRGGQLPNAESLIYAGAGDELRAARAGEEMLATVKDYRAIATTHLHEALCMVVTGGIDEGVRHASATLDKVPVRYRETMTIETGRIVLRAVPVEQRNRSAVTEFRALLAVESRPPHLGR